MTDMQDTGRKPNPEETNQTACPSSPGVQAASRVESGASAEPGADLPGVHSLRTLADADALRAAARALNLVYKPCGAGGGDVGIILGSDAAELDAFVAALPSHFSAIDCTLDAGGVKIDENTPQ